MRKWSFHSAPRIQLWRCESHGMLAPSGVAPAAALSVTSMDRALEHDERKSVGRVGQIAEYIWAAVSVASVIINPKLVLWLLVTPAVRWLMSEDRFYRRLERQLRRSRAASRAFRGYGDHDETTG
jgi:hypothetical protein